jgi:hypothetical protein
MREGQFGREGPGDLIILNLNSYPCEF